MIVLKISQQDQVALGLLEKLEEMTVARKIIDIPNGKEPILQHNLKTYKGVDEINEYLVEFKSFIGQWYQCLCD